ncbi:MAG: DUF1801 domain-containing protein [Ignavibacteriales bacterium]|nr:DUF1801 domain-containing protein [Ignavibacteriales bacterium]
MQKPESKLLFNTIDEYLSLIPEPERIALEKLRVTIKKVVPNAEETISYQIPTIKYFGPLVGFAAFKKHCSLFVMSNGVIASFKDELKENSTETGTIHFTPDKPLPAKVVQSIVKARMAENELKQKLREENKRTKRP